MNAILYIAATGCQWRQLPKDFPPMSTVQGYFYDWLRSGLIETIRALLATPNGVSLKWMPVERKKVDASKNLSSKVTDHDSTRARSR
jgi:transposase